MKLLRLLLLSCTLGSVSAFARPPAAPPKASPAPVAAAPRLDSTVVDCGRQKVAVFAGTTSKDGHYALAWTLVPHRVKRPVNWAAYDPKDPGTFIGSYPTRDDLSPGDYALIDGVVDLRARRFTPLVTTQPYYPQKPEMELHVAWSDDGRGTRFALVGNDAKVRTYNLWLIEADPRKTRASDLAPAADHAVNGFLRKQKIKQTDDYRVAFTAPDPAANAKPPAGPFQGTTLEVPFQAQVPRTDNAPRYAGILTMTLAHGKVTGIQGKKTDTP